MVSGHSNKWLLLVTPAFCYYAFFPAVSRHILLQLIHILLLWHLMMCCLLEHEAQSLYCMLFKALMSKLSNNLRSLYKRDWQTFKCAPMCWRMLRMCLNVPGWSLDEDQLLLLFCTNLYYIPPFKIMQSLRLLVFMMPCSKKRHLGYNILISVRCLQENRICMWLQTKLPTVASK